MNNDQGKVVLRLLRTYRSSPKQLPRGNRGEFFIVEYQLAAEQYRTGVDLGVTFVRSFIGLNGLLLAVIAAISQLKFEAVQSQYIIYIAALLGTAASVCLAAFVPSYRRQLDVCMDRSIEIEKLHSGQLYHRIKSENGNRRFTPSTFSGVYIICTFFFAVWMAISTVVFYNPSYFDGINKVSKFGVEISIN